MSNKYFALLLAVPILAFLGWLYFDSRAAEVHAAGERRDLLTDGATGATADIRYLFQFADPVYSHALGTHEIEELAKKVGGENYHVYGLTDGNYKMDAEFHVNDSKAWFKSEYTVWVENVQVEFSFTKVNVYVTSAYPEGSCEYQVTLDHENEHVAIHRRIYTQYQKILQDAVAASKDIPLASHPVTAVSLEEGKDRVGKMVSAVVDPVFDRFRDELEAEQAKIDTPENYRGLNQRCQHW